MKKLFIITGEHSGDKHAADVVKEIRKLNPNIEIEGVGGNNLAELGVRALICGTLTCYMSATIAGILF